MKRVLQEKKKWIFIGLVLCVVVIGGFLFSGRYQEAIPEYVFTYADNQAEDYPTTQGAYRFSELVEERTGGRIKIIVAAEGEMGTETEVIKQLRYGGIDFSRVSISQLASYEESVNVLQMPYLYDGPEHMWQVLDGQIGDWFLHELEDSDLVGLSWYDAGARSFYFREKKVTCLEDMRGLHIRVQDSALMADMIEALGAIAEKADYADVYGVLERGIVEGAENNIPSYESMQHYEVAPYYVLDEHTRVPEMQLCAMSTWQQLSEEDRQILLECAKESALYERQLWVKREEQARKRAEENGALIYVLSVEEKQKFQRAVQGLYEKHCGSHMDMIEKIMKEK